MKTKKLIERLNKKSYHDGFVSTDCLLTREETDEIIQRLMEFDELKRVIHDTVDTAQELYSFLLGITGENDSEGSFESMEE